MFYGPLKETREIIPVKQTTFDRLIKYFYQVKIYVDCFSVSEIFELLNLAERYDVAKLKIELKKMLQLFQVTRENLMETASIACQFSMFEDSSSALLLNCAKFLYKNITSPKEIVEFTVDQHAKGLGEVHLKLFGLIKNFSGNCGEPQPCLKGHRVAHHDLRKGLKVEKTIQMTK